MTAAECLRSDIYLLLAVNILHFNWHLFLKQPNVGTAQITPLYVCCSSVLSDCPISSSPLFPHSVSIMAPPTEELLTKAIYPSLCTSPHAAAQNNKSLFLSALFYSLTHSGRQHMQRKQIKGKRWQLRLAETQQAHLGNMLRAREERKNPPDNTGESWDIQTVCPPTLHLLLFSFKLHFNFPSCELPAL